MITTHFLANCSIVSSASTLIDSLRYRYELPRVVKLATCPMGRPDVSTVIPKHQGRSPAPLSLLQRVNVNQEFVFQISGIT